MALDALKGNNPLGQTALMCADLRFSDSDRRRDAEPTPAYISSYAN
jgi:hypothetical protein